MRIKNIRAKKVGSNLEEFETNRSQASDADVIFPEEMKNARYHRENHTKVWNYLELLYSMLLDSFNRRYPMPKKTIAVITFAILYLISPIDISPDILPLLGFVDDVAVLAFAFNYIKDDLEDYRAWKISNQ